VKAVKIIDITGDAFCVATTDGQKVYDVLYPILKNGDKVEVSFEGVELMISAFLNVAIGQLYGVFCADAINEQLSITNLCDDNDKALLDHVIDNAKRYFSKKKPCNKTLPEYA
jgi:hypothetical protein